MRGAETAWGLHPSTGDSRAWKEVMALPEDETARICRIVRRNYVRYRLQPIRDRVRAIQPDERLWR